MSKLLDGLNPAQREAVKHTDGPLLIIAGPGSGKTETVARSIAYAIEKLEVGPSRIAAFTFTNKAKDDLKKRISDNIIRQDLVNDIWIRTFHSFCGHVWNKHPRKLVIENERDFTAEELTRVYRAQITHLQYHQFDDKEIFNFIREYEKQDISLTKAGNLQVPQIYVDIYKKYTQILEDNNDIYTKIQLFTNALLRDVHEVKTEWQEKFELIFVDEFQDTDPIQYQIIKTLAGTRQNLRVVGDDDQGIYGWRGADIQNILNFENDYRTANKPITLGQNYRSTQRIVDASCALVEFNPDRREKDLFTKNFKGEKVKHLHCENADVEANAIADFISRAIQEGQNPSNFVVLYRTKDQAHTFEEAFRNRKILYYNLDEKDNLLSKQPKWTVSLMTIHKSKGLEFPNVFVSGVCSGLLPHHKSKQEDWDEELRLLYVAMTRAKNWLCLSSYEEDAKFPRGRSEFLSYIPSSLLKTIETLDNIPIPPKPEEMERPVTKESSDYVEPLPEKLLGVGMTVIGVDPGNIGAGETNVGWSVTEKISDGYSVLAYNTEQPTGKKKDRLKEIERKINSLVASFSPDAIAVEKIEIGTEGKIEDWFYYVASCVATIRSIADQHEIECRLYTAQDVKYAATNDKNAKGKMAVQKGVKKVCNLKEIPESDHSADAIAASLCYLRSHLNSSRFEGNKRKEERWNKGCAYLDKGQYDAAVSEFTEAINIDPIYTDAHYGLGRASLAQGDLEAAEDAVKTVLRLTENNHPDSQKLLDAIECYHLGRGAAINKQFNEAITKFQESINLEPIFTEAHCGLGRASFEIDNLEAAKNAAEEALRLRDEYPPAQKLLVDIKMRHYNNGKIYLNREEYRQAIFEFQKAVEIDKNFKGAHRFAGEAYLKLGDLEKSEKGARDALDIDQNYKLAKELLEKIKQKHKEHGDGYRKKNAFTKALKSYQQAIRIDDKYKEAYHNLGILYRKMKNYDDAITAYQKAIDIDERSHVTYSDFSFVYREIGETATAIDLLKRAIAIKPDYQRAYYNLADTYFDMEHLQDASEKVLEALRLDDNDQDTLKLQKNIVHAYLKQGRDYFKRGNLEAAKISAKAILKLDSNYQPAHKLLEDIKQTYYKQGLVLVNRTHPEAINALQKAVEIDPDFKEAHYSLGEFYFKIRDLEAAQKEAREALGIDQNYEPASDLLTRIKEEHYRRGLTSLKQNEWKAAEKSAEEVLKIDRNYKLASILLKNAYCQQALDYEKSERYRRSINLLQKAENIHPNCEKTHYYLGRVYFKVGKLKEARAHANKALSIQPNYPPSQKLLKEIKDARNWLKLGGKQVRRLVNRIAKRIGF